MKLENVIKAVTEAQTQAKPRKFEEAMEVIVNLKGIDLRKGGRQLNLDVPLPHGIGEDIKICIFASGDLAYAARQAGVESVLEPDAITRLETDRDAAKALADEVGFFIAQADLMPLVGRVLGPILGPRGKMPRPVTPDVDIANILSEFSSSVKLRMRKNLVIQAKVGKRSMDPKLIAENILAVVTALEQNLERGMQNIHSVLTKTTMGPAVKIEL